MAKKKQKMVFTVEAEVNQETYGHPDHDFLPEDKTKLSWREIIRAKGLGALSNMKVLCAREVGTEEEEQAKDKGNNIIAVVGGGCLRSIMHDIPELNAVPLVNVDLLDADNMGEAEVDDKIAAHEDKGGFSYIF